MKRLLLTVATLLTALVPAAPAGAAPTTSTRTRANMPVENTLRETVSKLCKGGTCQPAYPKAPSIGSIGAGGMPCKGRCADVVAIIDVYGSGIEGQTIQLFNTPSDKAARAMYKAIQQGYLTFVTGTYVLQVIPPYGV